MSKFKCSFFVERNYCARQDDHAYAESLKKVPFNPPDRNGIIIPNRQLFGLTCIRNDLDAILLI